MRSLQRLLDSYVQIPISVRNGWKADPRAAAQFGCGTCPSVVEFKRHSVEQTKLDRRKDKLMLRYVALACALTAIAGPAAADPWKDESGKGEHRDRDGWRGDYSERVPKGQRPPPGECKVWIPGVPAGQQPPPMSCREAREQAYYYGGRVIRHERRRDRNRDGYYNGYYGY